MSVTITEDLVSDVIGRGDLAELQETRAALRVQKQDIQIQLVTAKSQMLSVRSQLVADGVGERAAQTAATNTTDHDWRGRAMSAMLITDRSLMRINARIAELTLSKGPATPKPRAPAPLRRVDVLRGTPDEIAKELQEFIAGGWAATSTIVMPDGTLIAMFRGDYVPEGP